MAPTHRQRKIATSSQSQEYGLRTSMIVMTMLCVYPCKSSATAARQEEMCLWLLGICGVCDEEQTLLLLCVCGVADAVLITGFSRIGVPPAQLIDDLAL